MKALLGVAVTLLVLVGAYALADIVTRGIVERTVADRIEQNLPENVEGDVEVSIGGLSVLAQLATGALEHVELSSARLTVSGVPIAARVVGRDVPVDIGSRPVGDAEGAVTIAADDVARIIDLPLVSDGLVLGEGTVSYEGSIDVLAFSVGYTVTAAVEVDGGRVLLSPESVTLGSGGNSVDVAGLVSQLMGSEPLPVCVARFLPESLEITSIEVSPEEAVVAFEADELTLTAEALSTRGHCA